MANNRNKKTDAENAKTFLTDIVKSYYLTTDEEKAEHRNKGALKYLKDTMVSAVVLSPNPVKRMRKETFLKYFIRFVLPSDYDTLIAFTSPEQNLKAFLNCPYLWDENRTESNELEDFTFTSSDILIPFFILQHLQQLVEQNLDTYLRQKTLSPYDIRERTLQDDNNDASKEEKYMHLVYTLQYYEIFMEEFRRRIMAEAELTEDEDKSRMEDLATALSECTDDNKKIILGHELLDVTQKYMAVLKKKQTAFFYPVLYMYHFMNLMAMLRILVIAEYVNINHLYLDDPNNKNKQRRRRNIELMIRQNLLGFDLYFFHYRDNPNLSKIFRELTITAEEANIIPDIGNQKEMMEFHRNLKMYIEQIQKRKVRERDSATEELLIKSRITLAKPFLSKLAALKQEMVTSSAGYNESDKQEGEENEICTNT